MEEFASRGASRAGVGERGGDSLERNGTATMKRLLRPVALLPFALAAALFVHAFTGEDHAVANGHGPELVAVLIAGGLLWSAWLAVEGFRARRARRDIGRSLAAALPGGGRLEVLAAVVALEAALAFAGIEGSEGRLAEALHLDPLVAGGLFALGGILFAAAARALARWAVDVGAAVADRETERIAPARSRLAARPRLVLGATVARVHRGRAPPVTISR